MTGDDVASEAWTWIGTPFKWQASLKGVGCDCKGLVWGVARELDLPEAASLHASVADYGDRVPVHRLQAGLAATFAKARGGLRSGDVLLLTLAGQPQHLGVVAGEHLIHTYSGGPRQVVATPLAVALRAWPLASAWRFSSLEA